MDDLRSRLRYPAAGLSGVLTVLAFPRYGQDYLAWVALAPLFWAAAGAGARRGFVAGWLAGVTLVSGGFLWVLYSMRAFTGMGRAADLALFLPWVLFESLPWGLLGLALGAGPRRAGAALGWTLAVLPFWVGLEHFYPHIFPWHLGGALYRRPWLLQCADLLGASGLTALVYLVNAAVLGLALWLRKESRFPLWTAVAAAAILAGANLYGKLRLDQVEGVLASAPELRVGMIQPVTPPAEKRQGEEDHFIKMETLTRSLERKGPLDLVLWPEGADTTGYGFDRKGRALRAEMNLKKATGFEGLGVPLVAGSSSVHERSGMQRNTAAYVQPGQWPPGFYHKNIRVLFGEYVPLVDSLPSWLRDRIGHVGTIEAGTDCPLFELPALRGPRRFRILICYEAILPGYVRAASGGADFLVNLTEDIWYGNTAHIEQHVSVLVLRAVEERISIARSANVGPSGVIDPAGRMAERTTPYEKTERAFVLRPVRLGTLYHSLGRFFPPACLIAGVIALAVRFWSRRKPAPDGNL